MVVQPGPGPKAQRDLEDMHRLLGFEQSVPKGLLPSPQHRSNGRRHGGVRAVVLHGRVLEVQSDLYARGRPRAYKLPHRQGSILLYGDAFWLKERRGHLSTISESDV